MNCDCRDHTKKLWSVISIVVPSKHMWGSFWLIFKLSFVIGIFNHSDDNDHNNKIIVAIIVVVVITVI